MISLAPIQVLGLGAPFAITMVLLGFATKAYFDKRKDSREDTRTERESESGIVETTRAAIAIVRGEMVSLAADLKLLREEKDRLKAKLDRVELSERNKGEEIEKLKARVTDLEDENARLRVFNALES